jgi:alkaline phosphatase D
MIGRTKTTPGPDDSSTPLALAVFSCSSYSTGYFNAYGHGARKDNVDYMVHLGDYIYEYGTGVLGHDPRADDPSREIVTLFGPA